MQAIRDKAAQVKLIIFDVDGVLTDGRLFVTETGEEIKTFHSRDGHGMKMLQSTGVEIGIITGRTSQIVAHRCNELGIQHVYQGQRDKRPAFLKLIEALSLRPEQVAYMGDDVVDLPVMKQVGFAIATQDAHDFVKKHADWHTLKNGGHGAAREACEFIMDAQGNLSTLLESYLN